VASGQGKRGEREGKKGKRKEKEKAGRELPPQRAIFDISSGRYRSY